MTSEEKFRAAVRVIHSLPKDGPYQPSNSTKLKFYGLYKQATEGKTNVGKPGFWDVIGRAKWEAWNKNGNMSKEDAMHQYVEGLKEIVETMSGKNEIVETMSFNGEVEDFLDSIGPFYEFVNLQGNEMVHIKERLEEVASSSGSSLGNSLAASVANSLAASVANSKENSPIKSLTYRNEDEEGEDDSDKAEISVETSTATYEPKAAKNFSNYNGSAFQPNGEPRIVPPPAPVHSYSHQNGYLKNALPNDNDDEEVLAVTTSTPCKEDLERDIDDENDNGHAKVKVTTSIETVASVATSGTESEKYYSGDSEPEIDDKYISSPFASSECFPSTSAAALALAGPQIQTTDNSIKKSLTSPLKKPKDRLSPKSSSLQKSTNADVVLHQTVERINRDVDHILARLRILEAAYAANAEGAIRLPANQQIRRRRILGDLSMQSIAFIVMWPFVVQFLIKLLRWWWRRRRNASASLR